MSSRIRKNLLKGQEAQGGSSQLDEGWVKRNWWNSSTRGLGRAVRKGVRTVPLNPMLGAQTPLVLEKSQPVRFTNNSDPLMLRLEAQEAGRDVFSMEALPAGGEVNLRFIRGGGFLLRLFRAGGEVAALRIFVRA
ncbi:MAG: hypothetical protein JSU88_06990 [Nitrospinaceae bacterium]|nr:MAG: hypothetical protein JSU88_06990 [Nitrospinaceae bacterium]